MNLVLRLTALVGLVCIPAIIQAQYQIIELADVQFAKSVGATIHDPSGAPVPKAVVQEFRADWKTVLRSTSTDGHGKFSFTPAQGRKIYFFQISAPGFDPLRFRLQVDSKHGATLNLKLTVAT